MRIGSVVGAEGQDADSTVTAMSGVGSISASRNSNTEPSAPGRKQPPGTGVSPRKVQSSYARSRGWGSKDPTR
jgi:hypothetical protein